jgi:multidrug efflux pump subunit AcrB
MIKRQNSWRQRLNISKLAIKYAGITVGFWLVITIAGIFAFSSLKFALFPDITFPVVVVNASAPIATAAETEAKLTNPLELQLKAIAGVDNIRSSTYSGQTVISLGFAVGTNLAESTTAVEAVVQKLALPQATTRVIPINLNESAVISYTVANSQAKLADLTDLTKLTNAQILPKLKAIPGVLKVTLLGVPIAAPQDLRPEAIANYFKEVMTGTGVRINGNDALAFQVIKRSDANTLEVVALVEKAVAKLKLEFPAIAITLAATQAEYIQEATHATIDSLIEALVLSVIIIFPFLWDWKATLISAIAIPISLCGTFIVMALFGFNLETITLLALALTIGIIVDDAIVDVENISRHLDQGKSPFRAALEATGEIGLTVTAATLTIVAVFLPVGLMGGTLGQFFRPFGITISASVMISLFVARTLSPLLAAYWLKGKPWKVEQSQRRSKFSLVYEHMLQWSLRHRWQVVVMAVLSFVVGIGLIPFIPKGFIPKLDRGEFNIVYTAPAPNLSLPAIPQIPTQGLPQQIPALPNPLADSRQVAQQLEAAIKRSPELFANIETMFTTIGSRQGEPNKGNIYIKLKKTRSLNTADMQDRLRQALPTIKDVSTSIEDIQFVDTGSEKPLQVALIGESLQDLQRTAIAIQDKIKNEPGFADVTITGDKNTDQNILEIQHLQSQRVAYVTANLGQGMALGTATDQVVAIAKSVLPAGVTINLGGDSDRSQEVLDSFTGTLALSVLCITVVLLLLFRNLVDPLVIVLSLPLSIVGAMLALFVTRSDFGMIAIIGVILLFGVVNKNAILIVDYINQSRRDGLPLEKAILVACPVRVRPILMTTASTVLGMLPIALGFGAGSELRSPLAVSVMGGLVTSTLLSLIVVPVLYSLLDRFRSPIKK